MRNEAYSLSNEQAGGCEVPWEAENLNQESMVVAFLVTQSGKGV